MLRRFITAGILLTLLMASAWAKPRRFVAARFGGECRGKTFSWTPQLAAMISRTKGRYQRPCDSEFCNGAFSYDLDHDGREEYFVRMECGATGNCAWGIFSDRPAKLRGVFGAWFFFIHGREPRWNALTTYSRIGGNQGVIRTLANRRGRYVKTSEYLEDGALGDPQPYLTRMGLPSCS